MTDSGTDEDGNGGRKRSLPAHIPGGMRTSTLGLIIAFIVILALYLYSRPDPTTNEDSPVYVPPTTTTTEPFTPQRTTVPTTSIRPTTTAPDATGSTPSATDTAEPSPTTTTTRGFQLPTLPGLQLPNFAPTTAPAP